MTMDLKLFVSFVMVVGKILRLVEDVMDGLCMAPQIPAVLTMGGGFAILILGCQREGKSICRF